jgi:anti-sigma factor RsiW
MKNDWHEQIQRYVDGKSSDQEAAALHQALTDDAALRALYLDYVNLEVALVDAAERSLLRGNEIDRTATFPNPSAAKSPRAWRWLAAAAACVALLVFVVLSSKRREPEPTRPDVAATFASTQRAIAKLSLEPASPLAWSTSPTASLLAPPPAPQ